MKIDDHRLACDLLAGYGLNAAFRKNFVDPFGIGCLQNDVCLFGFDRKSVHIFDVDPVFVDDVEKLLQASDLMVDADDGNVREKRREAVFAELLLAERGVVHDETEKSEFGGIRKAQGENVLDMTKESAKNTLGVMGSALLGILAAMPLILRDTLNPVVAVKQIGNVTYKLIDTSFMAIAGGFLGLAMLAIVIFISAYVAGAFISIASVIFFFCITIIKFFKNRKEYKNIEQK